MNEPRDNQGMPPSNAGHYQHEPTADPYPMIFPARMTAADNWQEQTVVGGNLQDYTGGRKNTSSSDPSAFIPLGGAIVLQEVVDGTNCRYVMLTGSTFKARITAVSGSFPVWSYTVQRVVSKDTTKTDYTMWVVDGVSLTATNGFEWTPASYPFLHGVGVWVENSSGAVSTTFGGGTAGNCLIRAIGVGAVVDVSIFPDQDGNLTYAFSSPNSAQA